VFSRNALYKSTFYLLYLLTNINCTPYQLRHRVSKKLCIFVCVRTSL